MFLHLMLSLAAIIPPLEREPFLRESIKSPDGKQVVELLGYEGGLNGQSFRAILRSGGEVRWDYFSAGRGFRIWWSPASDRFLLVQTLEERSTAAWVVRIYPNRVSVTDLNLTLLSAAVEERLPEKHGNSAPKDGLKGVEWVSPTHFKAVFWRRFLGKNADVDISVETAEDIVRPLVLKIRPVP